MRDWQNPDPDKVVEVFAHFDPTVVSIARDALESVEIEGFIFDENASPDRIWRRTLHPRSSDGVRRQSR